MPGFHQEGTQGPGQETGKPEELLQGPRLFLKFWLFDQKGQRSRFANILEHHRHDQNHLPEIWGSRCDRRGWQSSCHHHQPGPEFLLHAAACFKQQSAKDVEEPRGEDEGRQSIRFCP